ncbi:HWE histidine kinase domain-containing protein [Devosia rhodophyticola]|uniref:histidine kinase n=1 Tax=Devosia rhodophyticola TaxID=3026423 RepID=A0ABY7YUW2_9HYPH|nr:HWE histidine kinase domain-containing protein [Devosia rhodophyticola]WDR04997.1 HWE histidine kinase domain-containing protein [Devosia rhodophyticola]
MASLSANLADHLVLRTLKTGLAQVGVATLHLGIDGRYDFADNLPPQWPSKDLIGKADHDILPSSIAARFGDARELALQTRESQIVEFELPTGTGQRRFFEAQFTIDNDEQKFAGITIVLTDVTEQRARDLAVAGLMREVSHRSKNLLAIVQSVAAQTAQHTGNIDDFLNRFRGRLQSLASTQDMVTDSNWRGTLFQSLASTQIARLGIADPTVIRITGDNPLLSPNAALHIGLALHELGVNAILYGALAEEGRGQIWIDARICDPYSDSDPGALIVQWQETGGMRNLPVSAPRFGTAVVERIVPLSVGGRSQYEINSDLVSYRLVVPPDQFEA